MGVAAMIFFEAPPPRYHVLRSVAVAPAVAPVASHRGSRFIASIVVIDAVKNRAKLLRVCCPTANTRRQVGPTPRFKFSPRLVFQDFRFSFNSNFNYPEIGLFTDVTYVSRPIKYT